MSWLKPTIVLGRPLDRPEVSIHCSVNLWVLLIYALTFLTSYQYCSLAYNRDPTSYFFDPQKGYEKRYSLQREQQAASFIGAQNISSDLLPSRNHSSSICLGLATIVRSDKQYVRDAIGSVLDGLSKEQRDDIHLVVLFAQTDPQKHPIYNEPWLNNVADRIVEYNASEDEMARLRSFEDKHQSWNKSMYDYNYLLRECLNTNAKWIMLVEDDVLAKAGWYTQAKDALQDIQSQMAHLDWLYLRLFYTEKLFGWNGEEWAHYLGWSFLAFIVTIIGLISARSCSRRLKKHISNLTIALICCFCLPATIGLYFMAGRVSMQPRPLGLQRMEDFGCCSQGLIFPREIVPRAMDVLEQATDQRYYVDMTLERWGNAQHLPQFALIPPLLQHVGSQSSKGQKFDEGATSIWNFEFENYT